MGKMTSEALALHRPTSGLPAGLSRLPPRLAGPTARQASNGQATDRRAILTRTVQLQVIPHLLQRSERQGAHHDSGSLGVHVKHLAGLLLGASGREVVDFVTGLLEDGFDAEAIFLELLAPTAHLLGDYWADDLCSFADVTVGVGYLQTAMHALRPTFFGGARFALPGAPRAVLLPLPGEQHSFGASMLSTFFARAGWDVWSGSMGVGADLAETVRGDWIDLVGLSVSTDDMVEATRQHIVDVRAASRNRELVVMVGGLPFSRDPSLADAVGADGTALDGAQAVEVAAALLPIRLAPP